MNELPALLEAFKNISVSTTEETECRLYYDESGSVITMTHGEHPGGSNYIVVTQEVYDHPNYNLMKVINGELAILDPSHHKQALAKSTKGHRVVKGHANILVDETYQGETEYYAFTNH